MHKSVAALCQELDQTASNVLAVQADNRRIPDLIGTWHTCALNREQLADIPADLSARVRGENIEELSSVASKKVDALTESVRALGTTIVPNLFNGNAIHSTGPYLTTFQYIAFVLDSMFGWRSLPTRTSMPATHIRRLQTIDNQLENLSVGTDRVKEQLQTINSAYEAAENLPATTLELKKLIDDLETSSKAALELLEFAKTKKEISIADLKIAIGLRDEAAGVIERCKETYRFATTTGLAGAFDSRANSLGRSMWVWVIGLIVSLVSAGIIGYYRLAAIADMLKVPQSDKSDLLVQGILSLISLGGPVWFAWLSTKQIGQRFRLSEDYAYKATLSKAYEGYKAEAVRIDPQLEKRLFSLALDRLQEAPLRLVEPETHGSPLHEWSAKKLLPDLRRETKETQQTQSEAPHV